MERACIIRARYGFVKLRLEKEEALGKKNLACSISRRQRMIMTSTKFTR